MQELLKKWAEINSGSFNLDGLHRMCQTLKEDFSSLGGAMEEIELPEKMLINEYGDKHYHPLGKLLHITKRRSAPIQVFFGGHMDTVYPVTDPFQKTTMSNPNTMTGPGVADMKGGLLILLRTLQLFEQHPASNSVGWEVVINPDEEIGSSGSYEFLKKCAKRNQIGFIFEPSYPDGAVVSSRKGSANWSLISHGIPAHAGRDFDKGRNAIIPLCKLLSEIDSWNHNTKNVTINVGYIHGGGAVNIVPALSIAKLNIRFETKESFELFEEGLRNLVQAANLEGAQIELILEGSRMPKPFGEKEQRLFEQLNGCALESGYRLQYRPSGGVCDGNTLAEHGLPVIDSVGVIGGNIHTSQEYVILESIEQRAQLIFTFLTKLATGKLKP